MKKIFSVILTLVLIFFANSANAAKHFAKPRLLIAEVANYGVNELKPEVTKNFYYALEKNLSDDFNVESRQLIANLGGEPVDDTNIFSKIHMDALANDSLYRRELVNSNVKNYADSLVGMKNKKNSKNKSYGKAYKLTANLSPQVQQLGEIYGVDYMLFCDVRDVDGLHKNSNFNVNNLLGKKIKVELEYYLVNVKSAKVFSGQISDKKTKISSNQLSKNLGKNLTANDVLNYILTEQARKIQKNILDKGFKAFNAK